MTRRNDHRHLPNIMVSGAQSWPYTIAYLSCLLVVSFLLTLLGVI